MSHQARSVGRDGRAGTREGRVVALAGLVLAQALVVVLAVLRWPGHPPFGSDHDEYRMLARSLVQDGSALIAGVEGTKYPLGWSSVLGVLDRLGADMAVAAATLNLLGVAATVLVVWLVCRRTGRDRATDLAPTPTGADWGAGAAAVSLAVGATLWGSVYTVMPDVALTAVTALAFLLVLGIDDATPTRRVVIRLTVLAGVAVLLKTAGLVLAGALTVALFVHRGHRAWSWGPVSVGLLLTGLQTWLTASLPEHTTGYGTTFWLRDPYDASQGTIGPAELPGRIVERLDVFWGDVAVAVLGRSVPTPVGIAIVLVLLALAVVAVRRWRWSVLAFVIASTVLLAAWPFRSPRFGLPLVPLAAVGFGVLVGSARRIGGPVLASVVVVGLLVPHGVLHVRQVRADAEAESTQLATRYAEMDELVAWIDEHVPRDEPIASMDYREIAFRTDRTVLPVPYTSDPEALLEATAGQGARYLVVLRGLYGRREARIDALLSTSPDRFERVFTRPGVDVHRIRGATP